MSRYEEPRPCGCYGEDNYCQRCDPERITQSLRERVLANKAKQQAAAKQRKARRDRRAKLEGGGDGG